MYFLQRKQGDFMKMTDKQAQIYEYIDNHFNIDKDKKDQSGFILISFALHKEGVISVQSNLGKKGVFITLKNMVEDFEK